jgi:hypothetical protein
MQRKAKQYPPEMVKIDMERSQEMAPNIDRKQATPQHQHYSSEETE